MTDWQKDYFACQYAAKGIIRHSENQEVPRTS